VAASTISEPRKGGATLAQRLHSFDSTQKENLLSPRRPPSFTKSKGGNFEAEAWLFISVGS
jgi:hypothetical protein